jgi:phenylpropionate dioxygenase-like ring-hydroxylating dioxygenase large terminal subunit
VSAEVEPTGGERLAPPGTKGHLSVARVLDGWYVACRSSELGEEPRAVTVLGTPLALFRGPGGRPGAVLDRCPHRNFPLAQGRVLPSGTLECGYHGWQFDGRGACRFVPGLLGEPADAAARRVPACAAREAQGFVWVWGRADAEPQAEPFHVPCLDDPRYVAVQRTFDFECTLHAALENALDVPHTAFLHRGRFRGGDASEIEAVRRRLPGGGLEVQYLGERRRPGEAKPRQGRPPVEHWDRFFLPAVAQVEYRDGERSHLMATILHTPIHDLLTRAYFVQCIRLPLPRWLYGSYVARKVDQVLRQDRDALRVQTESIRRFGGERYASTELDLMGPEIWRMLKQAERGLAVDEDAPERRVKFLA